MNKVVKVYGLLPGDRIVVPKSGLRIIHHHAVYLGKNHLGVDLIAENKIGFGVRLITADDFFEDVIEVIRIQRFEGSNYQRRWAIQKALARLGQPYDLINYNCEHFANDVQYNLVKSEQVDGMFEGLKAAAVLSIAIGLFNLINND